MVLSIIIVAVLALGGVAFFVMRGKLAGGDVAVQDFNFNIEPISNTRYMNVEDNVVEDYDCWYFREGYTQKKIQVTGSVDVDFPGSGTKYTTMAEIRVCDISDNEDFSIAADSALRPTEDSWYELPLGADGHFSTAVVASVVSDGKKPDFDRLDHNVLCVKVYVRISVKDSKGAVVKLLPEQERKYTFIVRPELQNVDIWMAFDPGTSGSCVAYGYGGQLDQTNNVHLAYNKEKDSAGRERLNPIFYSKIKIDEKSRFFKGVAPADMEVFDVETNKGDFYFGNLAHILWGRNSFQSIKKLLGYRNELDVEGPGGQVRSIKGEDLAHLLVKGLCHEFRNFIKNDTEVQTDVRNRLLAADGSLTPSRAIVAVPNNYTVNKVQAMVDTVKRTGLFKEVHYIYEAEGVMMYYLNLNWRNLPSIKDKTFVVFDMGGATINATAFRINVTTDKSQGGYEYTSRIDVDTVSRIGYTVGGDNIDFALIKILYGMPSMKQALKTACVTEEEHRRRNKKAVIAFVQKLKLDYIRATNGDRSADNWAVMPDTFWTHLFSEAKKWGLTLPAKMTDNDKSYFGREDIGAPMRDLVMSSVGDAVDELLHGMENMDVVLIFSGRSVLYPGVKETVFRAVSRNHKNVMEWNYEGARESREEAVKTAVVRGACWYAMFSRFVKLTHNKVTSTFGYIDMVGNVSKFVPVIPKNTLFEEDGSVEREVAPMYPPLSVIEFIQMLGHNYDTIFNDKIQHKMNQLYQITPGRITGNVQSIKVRVDYNNNFSFEVYVAGESEPIVKELEAADTDICDRNSEAYSFAALSSLDDNKEIAGKADESTRLFTPVQDSITVQPEHKPKTESVQAEGAKKKRRF